MKQPLKQALREQLESLHLNAKQLEKLEKIQSENNKAHAEVESNKPADRHLIGFNGFQVSRALMAASVALVLLASVVLTLVLLPQSGQQSRRLDQQQVQRIAEEVANSHIKMKPLEVASTSVEGVQHYFDKLDFLPQLSRLLADNRQNTLAGGRYCSIQGISAAQLRYKSATDKDIILFETVYDPRQFVSIPDIDKGEQPLVTYAKGVKVSLWVEKGLLMVQTEQP